jgi:hypothetical protein
VPLDALGIVESNRMVSARDVYQYQPGWGLPPDADAAALAA